MKNSIKLFSAIVLMAGFSTAAMAQTGATVAATTAGAKIVVPMTLIQDAPLNFGSMFVVGAVAGTCVLPSNGITRTYTGGVTNSPALPAVTNAAYHVTGTFGSTYALTLPATITVTETITGTATMSIGTLTARFNGALADAVVSTLSSGGIDNFTLGGTLTVGATQAAGIYAGTFPVTVDYN